MTDYITLCKLCGKPLSGGRYSRRNYCPECAEHRKAEGKRESSERYKARAAFAKSSAERAARRGDSGLSLAEALEISRATGLSYGKVMEKYGGKG